ncbi:NrdH-redoxin [candidate division WOR-1 bacterium RIFOXYA12_FULL_43_27]|nr:MAG: NrdH-redoxin [candidate division WOR-1 bacterium RIFOXYA12_FULL_43_27]OGC19466.1 MAG: NrdH-redoxin [candidate division WOR-1 bacterium RIFOXYB2_FULL_46_45]OGC30454.1 MAG: NrdH-redoxin [candidate division WOR-1 bacterium RIFOXYA2_FULL_46_56]
MPNVKVYSTATCPYCHMVKKFLDDNKVTYENIDVSEDQKAAQEMIDKSGQMGVPVIMIDEKVVVGFNKEEIKKALGL